MLHRAARGLAIVHFPPGFSAAPLRGRRAAREHNPIHPARIADCMPLPGQLILPSIIFHFGVRHAFQLRTPKQAVSAAQLTALRSRPEALHAPQLLSADGLYTLGDVCCDVMELKTVAGRVVSPRQILWRRPTHSSRRHAG